LIGSLTLLTLLTSIGPLWAQEPPAFTRQQDVIYGRKDGMALTLDVLTPVRGANGAAVIWVVSGGWYSWHDGIKPAAVAPLLARGYTVFAVVHGSQPHYTIPEAVADLNRAVRYVRFRAEDFQVDPERFGITGGSAGGHLSLMIGTAGDAGDPAAKDPVARVSSRVQAVACFFPPTDFLNYGETGSVDLGTKILVNFRAPFEFRELDPKQGFAGRLVPITDEARMLEIAREISPVYHVTGDDPPTLILHGDADKLVPFQQAELMMARFKEAGVPAELSVKQGAGHGWNLQQDWGKIVDWFDQHLKVGESSGSATE
jgi:acetyl esterase/lipase